MTHPVAIMIRSAWFSRTDLPDAEAEVVNEWLRSHRLAAYLAFMVTATPAFLLAGLVGYLLVIGG